MLIDLGGFTGGGVRLAVFGSKPAPVQASYLGYPFTSAIDTIDYRISDSLVDPTGLVDHLYAEQLTRLEDGHFAWEPYAESESVSTCKLNPTPMLGCFNNPSKISGAALECWAKILLESPQASILFR